MDFICIRRIWPCRRQGSISVDKVHFGTHAGVPDNASTRETYDIPLHPTPGEILAKIAGVISICLGLALLARILITPPPMW
jgi:hypothetical protein